MLTRLGALRDRLTGRVVSQREKLWDVAAVAGSRIVRQGVLLVAMAVAARVLGKELLGVWALINIVIQFGVLISDGGLSPFVIREKDLEGKLYSTVFYTCLVLSFAIASVTAVVTAPVASLMGFAAYKVHFVAASAAIFPMGINALLQAVLRREKRFSAILLTDVITNLVLLVGIVTMLLMGAGLWAFIVPTITASVIGCIACASLTGIPTLAIDRVSLHRIIDYSWGLIAFTAVHFWSRNADHALIGRFLGAAPLGIYSVAYRIMMLPLSQINSIAITVALPYMSPHQDDQARLRVSMHRLLVLVGAFATTPVIFVWLQRYRLVDLFLGDGWERVGDLLFVLVPLSLFQVFVNPIGLCFQVSGQTRAFFKVGMFQTLATILSFVVGVWLGSLDDVVVCYTIAILVASPVGVSIGLRSVGSGLGEWFLWCSPYLLALPACWFLHEWLGGSGEALVSVAIDAAIAAIGGGVASWVAVRAAWRR